MILGDAPGVLAVATSKELAATSGALAFGYSFFSGYRFWLYHVAVRA